MTVLQSSSFLSSCSSAPSTSSCSCGRGLIRANINNPRIKTSKTSLPILQSVHEQALISYSTISNNNLVEIQLSPATRRRQMVNGPDPLVIKKLYAIKEAVADRVEMHRNIGEQRSQWNNMLLTSINGITLAAATMVGIAASSGADGDSVLGLKMSSTLMYLAASGMMAIINKIQPSQLAEEQRNATRLFQDLHNQIETTLSIGHPSAIDVKETMDKVLALDKAYPLPLLGVMLEKFPSSVEPAI
ncbi:probable F-box protein At4g22030 [Lycium barbarum]|uniref:probable F-box protein At4g22030 n=1 Tax=Lycium barbarum TaxID=112863 RepID=UPI00293F25F5|nr:probable F-box protein At4g22030 [Lycium barbarum]